MAESAASAARTVANNIGELASLLKSACGIFLMGFGLLSLCHFTMIWLEEKKQAVVEAPAEEAPAEEVPAEEAPAQNEAV